MPEPEPVFGRLEVAPGRYVQRYVTGQWTDLSAEDARALTEAIKRNAEHLYALLYQAWRRKAWAALGYATFAEYVGAEFTLSRSRAYQLLDQAKVVGEISQALSTDVDIPEVAARELKPVLPEVIERIRAAVAGVPPERVASVTAGVIEQARHWRRAEQRQERNRRRLERYEQRVREGVEVERRPWRSDPVAGSSQDAHDWTPSTDDRGLSIADTAILDAHHSAWSALTVLEGLDLKRVAGLLTGEERKEYLDRAEVMRRWLEQYQAAVRQFGR